MLQKLITQLKGKKLQRSGRIPVPGGKIWYQRFGGGERTPLVLVHGGPGFPHNYLLTLKALSDERPVIFYDQLGCGESQVEPDTGLWEIERFVEELKVLLHSLAPNGAHLLGHSWGSIPVFEYLAEGGFACSAVFASPSLDVPRWLDDSERLRAQLPAEAQKALQQGEKNSDFDASAYRSAVDQYYQRFVSGSHRFQELSEAAANGAGRDCYLHMWGPNEFMATGNLKNYSAYSRLGELKLPVLFTCGRTDEATPETCEILRSQVADARLKVFELSAHHPHLSEAPDYARALREFFQGVERRL